MHAEYVIDITETEYEDTTTYIWDGQNAKHPRYHGF
jgi:hypothetical protein